jgi:hypothetical protein
MGDIVVYETAEGTVEELDTDDDDTLVNVHINEDKRAVVVKYHDRREIIPLERLYRMVEHNNR